MFLLNRNSRYQWKREIAPNNPNTHTASSSRRWHPIVVIVGCLSVLIVGYSLWYRFYRLSSYNNNNNNNNNNNINNLFHIDDDGHNHNHNHNHGQHKHNPEYNNNNNNNIDSNNNIDINNNNNNNNNNIDNNIPWIYNITWAQYKRNKFQSKIFTTAEPFLVGLGAEKSGSTSLGDAIFTSRLLACPKDKGSDTETRYWSECIKYETDKKEFFKRVFITKDSSTCPMKDYVTYGNWRSQTGKKLKFEKSVDFFGVNFIAYLYTHYYIPVQGTKIFVMIRYPPPRIQSTYYFFVGHERTRIPAHYGNVNNFAMHLLENKELIKLRENVAQLNWSPSNNLNSQWPEIVQQWNIYMRSLVQQCLEESKIAGFPSKLCNPPQLLRRAVGLSCYVVPIMEYLLELRPFQSNQNEPIDGYHDDVTMLDSFRIIQTELYFTQPSDVLISLMCWAKYGTHHCDDEELKETFTKKVQVKKMTSTGKEKLEFDTQTLQALDTFFEPCHQRLFELLATYPELALMEFNWEYWGFRPDAFIVR